METFQLVVNLFITLSAIASPDIVSSNKHPRYLTLKWCLICISSYFVLRFLIFFLLNLEAKSVNFVFSLPKCILSLLSTNQSHISEKILLYYFSVSSISLCLQTNIAFDSLRYVKNKSGSEIELLCTPQETYAS